jgi:hypothetical protein
MRFCEKVNKNIDAYPVYIPGQNHELIKYEQEI